jgi:hypothetical protein
MGKIQEIVQLNKLKKISYQKIKLIKGTIGKRKTGKKVVDIKWRAANTLH